MSPKITSANGIGPQLNRTASPENLKKAGQQFEAVFTGMMLKSMRQAKLADPLFDNKGVETFRDMQDAQVAQAMAVAQPMGIGKAMTDFLSRSQGDLNPQPPNSAP